MRRRSLALVPGIVVFLSGCLADPAGPAPGDPASIAFAPGGAASLIGMLLPIRASAINNDGTIVGSVAAGAGRQAALIDRTGRLSLLPGLGGANSSAEDINNHGVIVGSAETAGGDLHAVVWRDGEISDLGTLGGTNSWASAINDFGQITGTSERAGGLASAFLFADGAMRELGVLPQGAFSWGSDVNDRGVVVGWSGGGGLVQVPTMWRDGAMIDLGTLAHEGSAEQINNRGQIVGASFPERQTWAAATFWNDGEIIDLGYLIYPCEPRYSLECNHVSAATAINKKAQIVGRHEVLGAFLWDDGVLTTLPAIQGTAWPFLLPTDINDHGTIVGRGGELWGRIPQRLARSYPTVEAAGDAIQSESGPRPWSAAYCRARGKADPGLMDLDGMAGCAK